MILAGILYQFLDPRYQVKFPEPANFHKLQLQASASKSWGLKYLISLIRAIINFFKIWDLSEVLGSDLKKANLRLTDFYSLQLKFEDNHNWERPLKNLNQILLLPKTEIRAFR